MTRIPRPVADKVQVNAEALGMHYSEYIAMIVANALGLPEHAPRPQSRDQEELPLKTA